MARKSTKQNVEGMNGPPRTPEEIFDEHFPQIRAAKLAVEQAQKAASAANSVYRNHLKDFKKAGGDADALLDALRFSKMEPEDATRQMQRTNIYMRRMGLPVGSQFGLFDDGQSVADKAEQDRMARDAGPERLSEKSLTAIEEDGFAAGLAGKSAASHGYEEGSPADLRWSAGWRSGQERLAANLGGGAGKETAEATAP